MSEPGSTRNTGTPWTPADDARLRELASENTPTRVIGLKLVKQTFAKSILPDRAHRPHPRP